MRISLLQFAPGFGQVESNLQTIEGACRGLQSDLVVLPELCTTGYQFKDRKELSGLAESAEGASMWRLAGVARTCGGFLAYGFAEVKGDRVYNSAALVGPEGLIGLYRKVHLFDDEKRVFDPGDLGFPVFDLGDLKVGLMVCFDWLFPESARSLALGGAQLIAHPANLVLPWCQRSMPTRALENRVFTATANRIGSEERLDGQRLQFTGMSRLVGPDGSVIADGPEEEQALITAEIDPTRALDKNITAANQVFADRRPDQYRMEPNPGERDSGS
jgi:predicted amidohydrolase